MKVYSDSYCSMTEILRGPVLKLFLLVKKYLIKRLPLVLIITPFNQFTATMHVNMEIIIQFNHFLEYFA